MYNCNTGRVYGGLFLIPLPSWEAKKVTTVSVSGSCHKPPFTPHTLRTLVRDNTEQVMSRSLFIGNRYSVAGCNRKSGSTVMF